MLPLILLTVATASVASPPCTARGHPTVDTLSEMPEPVRTALAGQIADRGQPFNVSDAIQSGQDDRLFMRVICGYDTPEGYIVEREQGGRGYNIGAIIFLRNQFGYSKQWKVHTPTPAIRGYR